MPLLLPLMPCFRYAMLMQRCHFRQLHDMLPDDTFVDEKIRYHAMSLRYTGIRAAATTCCVTPAPLSFLLIFHYLMLRRHADFATPYFRLASYARDFKLLFRCHA